MCYSRTGKIAVKSVETMGFGLLAGVTGSISLALAALSIAVGVCGNLILIPVSNKIGNMASNTMAVTWHSGLKAEHKFFRARGYGDHEDRSEFIHFGKHREPNW